MSAMNRLAPASAPDLATPLEVALHLLRAGNSVVPIPPGGSERPPPGMDWAPYRDRLPTEDELWGWFSYPTDRSTDAQGNDCARAHPDEPGVGVVYGGVSGHRGALTFPGLESFRRWATAVAARPFGPAILADTALVLTPRREYQAHFRTVGYVPRGGLVPRTGALAVRLGRPGVAGVGLCGEGDVVLAPWNPPRCNPVGFGGRRPRLLRGDFARPRSLTAGEATVLVEEAGRLNEDGWAQGCGHGGAR